MPATGLKIVGTGACLPWCSISSSFQNSLKTSGHRGYEFLEFWCWNLVPFLPDIGFQLLKSLWLSLTYFSFNDAPNVLYRWKIWTAGRPIQHPDSSTEKPCCCNSYSMWFCIVLLKYTSRVFPALNFFLAAVRTNFCPAKSVFDRFMWFMSDVNDCCACDNAHVNWGRESRESFPAHSLWACLHLVTSCIFSGRTAIRSWKDQSSEFEMLSRRI